MQIKLWIWQQYATSNLPTTFKTYDNYDKVLQSKQRYNENNLNYTVICVLEIFFSYEFNDLPPLPSSYYMQTELQRASICLKDFNNSDTLFDDVSLITLERRFRDELQSFQ